jgi:hypothetical protein
VEPSSKRRFKKGTNPYSRMTPGPDTSATFFEAEMTRVALLSGGVANFRLGRRRDTGTGCVTLKRQLGELAGAMIPT